MQTTGVRRSNRVWRAVAVAVALAVTVLVAGALLVNSRLDPYRVGTTHEVVLHPGDRVDECGAHWIARLDNGSTWIPAGPIADGDEPVPIPGTITITAPERGRFESDPEVGSMLFSVTPGAVALDCTPPS